MRTPQTTDQHQAAAAVVYALDPQQWRLDIPLTGGKEPWPLFTQKPDSLWCQIGSHGQLIAINPSDSLAVDRQKTLTRLSKKPLSALEMLQEPGFIARYVPGLGNATCQYGKKGYVRVSFPHLASELEILPDKGSKVVALITANVLEVWRTAGWVKHIQENAAGYAIKTIGSWAEAEEPEGES